MTKDGTPIMVMVPKFFRKKIDNYIEKFNGKKPLEKMTITRLLKEAIVEYLESHTID